MCLSNIQLEGVGGTVSTSSFPVKMVGSITLLCIIFTNILEGSKEVFIYINVIGLSSISLAIRHHFILNPQASMRNAVEVT